MARLAPGKRFGRTSPGGRRLFSVSGTLFNSTAIESLMDKNARRALEGIGRVIKRRAKRSLKLAKRARSVNQIRDEVQRRIYARALMAFEEGRLRRPPTPPFIPSKPGRIPKIRKQNSLLKKGIFFSYDGGRKEVIVGPAKIQGLRGDAPHALEHGGVSNGELIQQRPFMSRALKKTDDAGDIKKIFKRNVKL